MKTKILVFAVIATVVLAFAGIALATGPAMPPKAFPAAQLPGVHATDAVSGIDFNIKSDSPHSEYKSMFYYFENPANKSKFDAAPNKYK